MNRIKELFENLITFLERIIPQKRWAVEVPETELQEETVEPTYSRSRYRQLRLPFSTPSVVFMPLPLDQDSPDHWARLLPLTGAISSLLKTTTSSDLRVH